MKNQNGFTLVELLITILVASILMATAVPAFNDFIQNNRITAASNELSTALAVARSEAIRRREPVTLCSSTNLTTCSLSTSWETGWIVFNDRNSNGVINNPPDRLLRVWNPLPNGFTVTTGAANQIQFDRLGAASATDTFQFSNPDCQSGQANRERAILLAASGAVGVTRTDCP